MFHHPIPIHPLINRKLNRDYHFDYNSIFMSLRYDPHLRHAIKRLGDMSNPPAVDPLVVSAGENARDAAEVINFEFLRRVSAKEGVTANLRMAISKAMREASFPLDKIEVILKTVDPKITVADYQRHQRNLHVIKARGFSSFESLCAFYNDTLTATPRPKKVEMKLDEKVVTTLIRSNDQLQYDTTRDGFLVQIRRFLRATENPASPKDPGLASADTLSVIRDNCVFNANLRLASETSLKTISLGAYAKSGNFPTRTFTTKDVGQLVKIIRKADAEIDLFRNEANITLSFNCFHCPSAAKSDANPDLDDNGNDDDAPESNVEFRDQLLAGFNVFRALPFQSLEDYMAHYLSIHTLSGDGRNLPNTRHKYLLCCRLCAASATDEASANLFVCCLPHFEDHNR